MGAWTYTQASNLGGRFQLVISKLTPGGRTVDASYLRGAPTQLTSYSEADPFGDSAATFSFPAITGFDDLQAADLGTWLDFYSNVDIFWVPAIADAVQYLSSDSLVINPLTNQPDIITPWALRLPSGKATGDHRIKVWEGFIASMDLTSSSTQVSLEIQCQGAVFQLDRYLQKPFYPYQPWPLENLILDAFDSLPGQPTRRPHLRTHHLTQVFPAGWKLKFPKFSAAVGKSLYTPTGKPGAKWSGYTSRETGAWDHALTGFVQNQLTVMITDARSGVTEGNQWTINQAHQSALSPGRAPVLQIRDRFRPPDFSLWLGTPGVEVTLSSDSTQSENVIYGDGTSIDGTVWRNAVINADGSRTDYNPLAAGRDVWPALGNKQFLHGGFTSEARTQFGVGFDQPSAVNVAEQQLARDREPGWTGTITLSVDPSSILPRWLIRAGMTVLLKGFAGSGETGIPFHIASKTVNPMEGTVALTVDTRYRDLLTVDEAQARTRDPLTPVKMLQVGRSSVIIADVQAPWDYTTGSGFVPTKSQAFFANNPTSDPFPYTSWSEKHSPLSHQYQSWYVKCNASAPKTLGRWAGPITILTSASDTIARTEFFCCDIFGRPVKVPFHVSLYHVNVHPGDMPHIGSNFSAFQNNAFEKVDPKTGQQTSHFLWPATGFITGWGAQQDGIYNRAGFWPGRESDGAPPTGLLVDDATYPVDNTSWNGFFKAPNPPGTRVPAAAISIYAMFYCDYKEPVYFMGRLYKQNSGVA
jgi:hypothetical protein